MKNIKITVIFILLIPLLTSCWSRKELNELAITTGIAIDKVDDKYFVTAQVLNPGEIAGQQQSTRLEVATFGTTGLTIFEAFRKLTLQSPRDLYLSHVRIIVFGEELAREGITEVLDFLSRDHEMRTDFFLTVAKNQKASEILKVLTSIEKIPMMKIFNSIDVAGENWAAAKGVQLDDLISKITSDGSNAVLTGVSVQGPRDIGNDLQNIEKIDSPTRIKIDYLGAFKEDKLVGWLNKDESKGLQYIEDKIENTVITVPCEDRSLSVEIIRSSTSVEGIVENEQPKIKIKVDSEGSVGEAQCPIDLSKVESLKKIGSKTEKDQENKIMKSIEKAQEWRTDFLGFGEAIHRADPKAWKKLSKNWDEHFSNLEIDIDINVDIRRLGTITDSFQK
ncbi:Ger(x)C family spore germination protein [Fredinandcohnia humi]